MAAVNPAAHCGRRPFFALGKGSAAAGGGVLCPGQRKGKEWNSGRSIR